MPTRRPKKAQAPRLNPIQRIRDAVRYVKPQQSISYQEWKQIEDRATQAELFMSEENEIYQLMLADLENAKDIILENRIKEVHEEKLINTHEVSNEAGISVIPEFVKKFITPKKEQVDELVGQYKYIKGFLAEMKTWIDFRDELIKKEADGQITIERNERTEI